jgi:hypothetical protein
MAASGLELESITHQSVQSIKALSHIRGSNRQSRSGWYLEGPGDRTLALAYAERHPNRVTEMVLVSVATTTEWEIDWITRRVGIFFLSSGPVFVKMSSKRSVLAVS